MQPIPAGGSVEAWITAGEAEEARRVQAAGPLFAITSQPRVAWQLTAPPRSTLLQLAHSSCNGTFYLYITRGEILHKLCFSGFPPTDTPSPAQLTSDQNLTADPLLNIESLPGFVLQLCWFGSGRIYSPYSAKHKLILHQGYLKDLQKALNLTYNTPTCFYHLTNLEKYLALTWADNIY